MVQAKSLSLGLYLPTRVGSDRYLACLPPQVLPSVLYTRPWKGNIVLSIGNNTWLGSPPHKACRRNYSFLRQPRGWARKYYQELKTALGWGPLPYHGEVNAVLPIVVTHSPLKVRLIESPLIFVTETRGLIITTIFKSSSHPINLLRVFYTEVFSSGVTTSFLSSPSTSSSFFGNKF